MITLFLIGYIVIALACVGFGLYLSEPGHTWSTLKDDALNLLRRRSRPTPIDPWPSSDTAQHDESATPVENKPKRPAFFEELQHNADTQCHRVTPPVAPASDENHESHEEAEPNDAVSKIIKGTLQSKFFAEQHGEAEPAEVVRDEP